MCYQDVQIIFFIPDDVGIKPSPLEKGYGIQVLTPLQIIRQKSISHIFFYNQNSCEELQHLLILEGLGLRNEVAGDSFPLIDQQFNLIVVGLLPYSELFLYKFDRLYFLVHVAFERQDSYKTDQKCGNVQD